MLDSEFSIALALASGIQYMALVVHNKCLMSDPNQQREQFINILVHEHSWTHEQAEVYFDRCASNLEIDDPIEFALEESSRLQDLFRSLIVVPLLYNVDNDRLFLIKDWQN